MSDEDELAPPPSFVKRHGAAILALLVGAGGGVGGALAFGTKSDGASDAEAGPEGANPPQAGATEGAGESKVTVGADGSAIVSLGAFTVNLRGGGGGRVLRIEVQVESVAAEATGIESKTAQLRDSIITGISDYSWLELEGASGKTRLRDELLQRVNGIVTPARVERIYFTQFIVQ